MVWAPYRSCCYLGFCLVNQVNRLHRALHDGGRRREECEHKQNTRERLKQKTAIAFEMKPQSLAAHLVLLERGDLVEICGCKL
jgi:hypothetical protein